MTSKSACMFTKVHQEKYRQERRYPDPYPHLSRSRVIKFGGNIETSRDGEAKLASLDFQVITRQELTCENMTGKFRCTILG